MKEYSADNKVLLGRYRCPKCTDTGNDSSGDNLAVYKDLHTHCFSCNYTGNTKKDNVDLDNLAKNTQRETTEDFMTNDSFDTIANFKTSTLKQFGITLGAGNNGGYYLRFPYHDDKGNLIAYKLRSYNPSTGKLERNIYFEYLSDGVIKVFPCFNYVRSLNNKDASTLLVFEGETDLMKFYECYGNQPGYSMIALSGVNTASLVTQQFLRVSKHFNSIIYFLDNDEAGETGYKDLLKIKSANVSLLRTEVNFRGANDVKELLTQHPETPLEELLKALPISNKGSALNIVKRKAADILNDYHKRVREPLINVSQYLPSLAKAWLPRKGNLFVIAGGSGKGKSFFLEWLVGVALKQNKKVLLLSLEMSEDDVVVRLINRMTGVNMLHNPYHTLDTTLKSIVDNAANLIDANLYLADVNGAVNPESIKATLGSIPEAVDMVCIDTFTNLADSLDWAALEGLAKALKEIATNKAFGEPMVLIVSQITANEGNDDYYLPTSATVLRGGRGLANYASVVIATAYSPSRGIAYLRSIKLDRMVGVYCDIQMQFINGNFEELANEPQQDYNNTQTPQASQESQGYQLSGNEIKY